MMNEVVITEVSGQGRRMHIRPKLIHGALLSMIFCSLVSSIVLLPVHTSITQAVPLHPALSTNNNVASAASSSVAPQVISRPVAPTQPVSVNAPSAAPCTPDTYVLPTGVNLAAAQPGLTQQVDSVHYYLINGRSAVQVGQQAAACAPKLSADSDDFIGNTSYQLNWQYDYAVNDAGQCVLSNIRVGSRVSEILPSLHTDVYTSGSFVSEWQAFEAALDTHEQGHIALDEKYASQLLNDLQSLGSTDCGTIVQTTNAVINNDVAALNAANINYDIQTDHGATQGAVLR